ncbi:MAG: hypothetical protein U5K56_02265 [Halioglobus sp.]|nr:hypothetical protein [Halioglobus sp.]
MYKTLFMHVGAPKTGTTMLQLALRELSPQLAGMGEEYPDRIAPDRKFPDKRFISTGNANAFAYSMRNFANPDIYPEFQLKDVLADLEEHPGFGENLVLSHEDTLYASPDFIKALTSWATEKNYEVKIILYIRDQLSWHASNYQQHVKQLAAIETLPEIVGQSMAGPAWLRYIKKFEHLVGNSNLLVRVQPPAADARAIVSDFLEVLGIDGGNITDMPEQPQNVSLRASSVEILRGVNTLDVAPSVRRTVMRELQALDDGPRLPLLDDATDLSLKAITSARMKKSVLITWMKKCSEHFRESMKNMAERSPTAADAASQTLQLAVMLLARALGDEGGKL